MRVDHCSNLLYSSISGSKHSSTFLHSHLDISYSVTKLLIMETRFHQTSKHRLAHQISVSSRPCEICLQ